jgi:hypothetical protein
MIAQIRNLEPDPVDPYPDPDSATTPFKILNKRNFQNFNTVAFAY